VAAQFNADDLGSLKAGCQPIPMDVLVPTTRTSAEALGIADRVDGWPADLLVVGTNPLDDIRVLSDRRNIAPTYDGGALVPRLPGA
jgi:imidazolonepropionase-like amidohydrolase